jgi:uncharacterized protein YhaN
MRFLSLDLERYGPFTHRSLAFREGARLHLIYGPNEAGKSTALAAVTDLLFGFEHRTAFDFLHAASELRAGACILARGGERLTFRRRKGRRDTLLDANDRPIAADALAPFLGAITRAVFVRAFGLSTDTLRAGAREMLTADGDVGATLFAAASGLHGPSRLRRALEAEAEGIFAQRASKDRRFYQALDRFEAARKAMRERELRAGDWKQLNESIASLQSRLAELESERARKGAERARLERAKRLAPLIRLLDQNLADIDKLGPVPCAPAGFADRLRAALAVKQRAEDDAKARAAELHELCGERDRLTVDERILAQADEIEELTNAGAYTMGAYRKAKEDLPGVERDADALRRQLDSLAGRLGLADRQSVRERLPTDARLALVRGLVEEGRDITRRMEGVSADVARYHAEKARLHRQRAEHGGERSDPETLRDQLHALQPILLRIEQRAELEAAIAAEETALAEAARRLDPPVASLDALASSPLPSEETIARFRKEHDSCERALDHARDKVEAADRSCREIALSLERLAATRPVPTHELIGEERARRDAEWERLRPIIFGAAATPELRSAAVGAFERHKGEADRLADAASADAERVAKHAVETQRLNAEQARHDAAVAALAQTEKRWRVQSDAWRAAWAAAGVSPKSPPEMSRWIAALNGLLSRREALRARQPRLAQLNEEAAFILPPLSRLANAACVTDAGDLPPARLAARIEERIKRLSSQWEQWRGVEAKIDAAGDQLTRLEAEISDATRRQEAWAGKWAAALPTIGLDASLTVEQADVALHAWKEAPPLLLHLAEEERRVAGMRRDNAGFERKAGELLAAAAPDLLGESADIAMKALQQRAAAARTIAARRDDCLARLDQAQARAKTADAALAEASAELAALAGEVAAPPDTDLRSLLKLLDDREAFEAAARGRREELLRVADGLDEAAIRAEIAGFDADLLAHKLSSLSEEDGRLDATGKQCFAELDRRTRQRSEWEQGVGAEIAAQQRRNAEAELSLATRQWAILKLGSLLLGTAIERHREAAQNPLMHRAGTLFSSITAGAFSGVATRYDDEDDHPVLVGRRRDGSLLDVDKMSEGTRDQLYLALRLAYVEAYAARAEPSPFIADDIFVTFDDERASHGLTALADIGASVQCILFTHHRRIVEIARGRLGKDVDVIELSRPD